MNEVVFPVHGEWAVEAYAWSKELARLLNISFQVLRCKDDEIENKAIPIEQVLEGDGYYFAHYDQSPSKTKVSPLIGDFDSQLIGYLNVRKGSIVVIADALLNSKLCNDLLGLTQHALISFIDPIQKKPDAIEFNNILRQVTFHHLPFDLFRPENYSLISRLIHAIRPLH